MKPKGLLQWAIEDAFGPIARDGASLVEVQVRLQRALASLSRIAPEAFARPVEQMAREALARAEAASLLNSDLALIRSAARLPSSAAEGARDPATAQDRDQDMARREI